MLRQAGVLFGALGVVLMTTCGVAQAAKAKPWTQRYIDSLPDSAFASVERTPRGKKVRHLPHHDRRGRVDLPHVREALNRFPQVHWIDPRHADPALAHLMTHLRDARHTGGAPRTQP